MRLRLSLTLDFTRAPKPAPVATSGDDFFPFEHRDNGTMVERASEFPVGFHASPTKPYEPEEDRR